MMRPRRGRGVSQPKQPASEPDFPALRASYDAFNRGDIDAVVEGLDAEFELRDSALWLDRKEIYRGVQGYRDYAAEILDAWENFRCEPVEFCDMGKEDGERHVVVICRMSGRARASGMEIEALVRHHWWGRGSKTIRAQFYWHLAEPEN
jgi:ketosteroid isomerase-like protein